jgi:hypothetical protein
MHQLTQQSLVEDVLEPDARGQRVDQLLARQVDLLFAGHAVPQRCAVQRDRLRRQEELVGVQRCVPVDVDDRLVGLLDRTAQQSFGELLARRDTGTSGGIGGKSHR